VRSTRRPQSANDSNPEFMLPSICDCATVCGPRSPHTRNSFTELPLHPSSPGHTSSDNPDSWIAADLWHLVRAVAKRRCRQGIMGVSPPLKFALAVFLIMCVCCVCVRGRVWKKGNRMHMARRPHTLSIYVK
jgi:hypothetical protein